ncbi:hypothetical protein Pcinc_014831 [Petrolisthes cinctipes]|uniref:Uncharacterized protein n=1 Tax=Petrolisthes cinctipes TaxID=88211 RepID=A0AAE1KR14_PETCI|nr:hypothetical protein Pcinc_014831 [Petrolisthes cinctipes]
MAREIKLVKEYVRKIESRQNKWQDEIKAMINDLVVELNHTKAQVVEIQDNIQQRLNKTEKYLKEFEQKVDIEQIQTGIQEEMKKNGEKVEVEGKKKWDERMKEETCYLPIQQEETQLEKQTIIKRATNVVQNRLDRRCNIVMHRVTKKINNRYQLRIRDQKIEHDKIIVEFLLGQMGIDQEELGKVKV